MSDTEKTVMCSRLGEELPAIPEDARLTFAGAFGARVRAEVSLPAWREWLEMQIKVINEYRLHMGEPAHRKALQDAAATFFKFDGASGELSAGPEGGL